jgi:uncharacterized membrane protein
LKLKFKILLALAGQWGAGNAWDTGWIKHSLMLFTPIGPTWTFTLLPPLQISFERAADESKTFPTRFQSAEFQKTFQIYSLLGTLTTLGSLGILFLMVFK